MFVSARARLECPSYVHHQNHLKPFLSLSVNSETIQDFATDPQTETFAERTAAPLPNEMTSGKHPASAGDRAGCPAEHCPLRYLI
jgi:hypothetical protein